MSYDPRERNERREIGPQFEEFLAKLEPAEALGTVVINERLISADNQAASRQF